MHRLALLLLAVLASANAGCRHEGADACDEYVNAYATRLVECGEYATYAEAEAAVVAAIAASTPPRIQSCDDVWGLRDRVLFNDECIPGIRALDCTTMSFPAACEDQLLYE